MHKVVVALVLALAGLVATAPADAATTSSAHATLSTRGAYVAPRACIHSHAGFKLDVDQVSIGDLRSWSARVTVSGPGRYHDAYTLDWFADDDVWHSVFFCGSPNRAGTYTVRVHLDITHDTSYVGTHTYENMSTTFRVWTRR